MNPQQPPRPFDIDEFPPLVAVHSVRRDVPPPVSPGPYREHPSSPGSSPPIPDDIPDDIPLPTSPPPAPRSIISIGSFIPPHLQLAISVTPGAGMLAAIDRTYRASWKINSYTRLFMWMTERVHILETHHHRLVETIASLTVKRKALLTAYAAHQAEATYHQQPSLRPPTHPLWQPPSLEETVREMRKLQMEMLKVDGPLKEARERLPGCMAELKANREYLRRVEERWKWREELQKRGEVVDQSTVAREVEEDRSFLGKYRAKRTESCTNVGSGLGASPVSPC